MCCCNSVTFSGFLILRRRRCRSFWCAPFCQSRRCKYQQWQKEKVRTGGRRENLRAPFTTPTTTTTTLPTISLHGYSTHTHTHINIFTVGWGKHARTPAAVGSNKSRTTRSHYRSLGRSVGQNGRKLKRRKRTRQTQTEHFRPEDGIWKNQQQEEKKNCSIRLVISGLRLLEWQDEKQSSLKKKENKKKQTCKHTHTDTEREKTTDCVNITRISSPSVHIYLLLLLSISVFQLIKVCSVSTWINWPM